MNWTKHCEHCLDLLIYLGARLSFVIWSINLIALWHIIASIFYFQHWYWHKYNKYQQRHLFLAAYESLPIQSFQSSTLNLAWTLLTLMLTLSFYLYVFRFYVRLVSGSNHWCSLHTTTLYIKQIPNCFEYEFLLRTRAVALCSLLFRDSSMKFLCNL